MKHIVSVLLCVTLLMTMLCLGASAAPSTSVTFTVTANDAKVGETVNVVVSISENSYFTNAIIYMHYDSAAMEYVSDELGAAASKSAMYMSNNFDDRGYVKMAYVAINGLKKGGDLFVFEFKVLDDSASEFTVSFEECVGADDDNNTFDVNYTVVPCIVNDNGQAVVTTAATVTTKTSTTKAPVTNKPVITTKAPVTTKVPATTRTTVAPVNGTTANTNVVNTTAKTNTTDDGVVTTTATVSQTNSVTITTDDNGSGHAETSTTVVKDSDVAATGNAVTVSTTSKVTETTAATGVLRSEEDPQNGGNLVVLILIVIAVAALVVVGAVVIAKKVRK